MDDDDKDVTSFQMLLNPSGGHKPKMTKPESPKFMTKER